MISIKKKRELKQRRHDRVRSKVSGTSVRPRLSVFRSLNHIQAQLIDDIAGKTLLAVSDKGEKGNKNKSDKARAVGKKIAELAAKQNINEVVFDAGGYKYHGRVKALADAARETGLKF